MPVVYRCKLCTAKDQNEATIFFLSLFFFWIFILRLSWWQSEHKYKYIAHMSGTYFIIIIIVNKKWIQIFLVVSFYFILFHFSCYALINWRGFDDPLSHDNAAGAHTNSVILLLIVWNGWNVADVQCSHFRPILLFLVFPYSVFCETKITLWHWHFASHWLLFHHNYGTTHLYFFFIYFLLF